MIIPDWVKNAKAGDKVTPIFDCDGDRSLEPGYIFPKKGAVYTIREILIADIQSYPCPSLRFIEIPDQLVGRGRGAGRQIVDLAWAVIAFRPVQPRATDITVFTDMLKTVPAEPVGEPA